jgi:hypothetical protein
VTASLRRCNRSRKHAGDHRERNQKHQNKRADPEQLDYCAVALPK